MDDASQSISKAFRAVNGGMIDLLTSYVGLKLEQRSIDTTRVRDPSLAKI